jgi:protein-tyrosine-phosphatase
MNRLHVLFVREHNSARSQRAEAFRKDPGDKDLAVESCGLPIPSDLKGDRKIQPAGIRLRG